MAREAIRDGGLSEPFFGEGGGEFDMRSKIFVGDVGCWHLIVVQILLVLLPISSPQITISLWYTTDGQAMNPLSSEASIEFKSSDRSPISSLPNELLVYIFRLVVVREARSLFPWGDSYHNYYTSIFSITSTCGRWRDAAISYPSLWNVILLRAHSQLPLGVTDGKHGKRGRKQATRYLDELLKQRRECAATFVTRSQNVPLELELNFSFSEEREEIRATQAILDRMRRLFIDDFLPLFPRCKSIRALFYVPQDAASVLPLLGDLPLLSTFTYLMFHTYLDPDKPRPPIFENKTLPPLKSFAGNEIRAILATLHASPSLFSQLENISILDRLTSPSAMREILPHCKNIKRLTLPGIDPFDPALEPNAVIEMPGVTSLHLVNPRCIMHQFFHFPNLEHLILSDPHNHRRLMYSIVYPWTAPSLRTVQMQSLCTPPVIFGDLLRLSQGIEEITLDNCENSATLMLILLGLNKAPKMEYVKQYHTFSRYSDDTLPSLARISFSSWFSMDSGGDVWFGDLIASLLMRRTKLHVSCNRMSLGQASKVQPEELLDNFPNRFILLGEEPRTRFSLRCAID